MAGGADNLQDPFNLVGRGDPLETAALLVMAGHLQPHEAYEAVSGASRAVLGLPPVAVVPGSPAELLAVRAQTLREAIGSASAEPCRHPPRAGRLPDESDDRAVKHEVHTGVTDRRSAVP